MQSAAVQANLSQISDSYKYVLSSTLIPPNQREEFQAMYETRIAGLEKQGNALEMELNAMK